MSSNQSSETHLVLEELSQVTDSAQFLKGVQGNPELVLDAIKELVIQSKEWSSAASVLQAAHSKD